MTTTSARIMAAALRYHGPGMDTQRFFAKQMKVLRILWAALTFSNVLLGVVTCFMQPHPGQVPDSQALIMLSVAAFGAAVASFVMPMRMHAQTLKNVRVEVFPGEPGPTGAGSSARFANPADAGRRAITNAFTPFILSMSLSEVPSLVGLSLRTMGGPLGIALALVAAGTLLAASRFPTPARLLAPFERAMGATFAASEGGSY
jgi:hypothetical protein